MTWAPPAEPAPTGRWQPWPLAPAPAEPLPPGLWAVVLLLVAAGLFLGVPVLRAVPDALSLLGDGALTRSFGLLVLILLVEVGLLAAGCLFLAVLLSRGDYVARAVTVVLAGCLVAGLLAAGVDDTATLVTVLACGGVMGVLTLSPTVSAFFLARLPHGPVPVPLLVAQVLSSLLAVCLAAVGVAYLPVASVDARFLVVAVAVIGISYATFRITRRIEAADPRTRLHVTWLMAGYLAAILLAQEGDLTGPLFVWLVMAGAVVALLWVPGPSRAWFGDAPTSRLPTDAGANLFGTTATSGATARPVPATPPSPSPVAPVPMAFPPFPADAFGPARRPVVAPAVPPLPLAPLPSPAAPPLTPPTPPAAPVLRRHSRRYELVSFPSSPGATPPPSATNVVYDRGSWFAVPHPDERTCGAYLVSLIMLDDDLRKTAFRGSSTLLVTSARLAGVCPRGDSLRGALDPEWGPIALWSVPLDGVDWLTVEGNGTTPHIAIRGWDADRPLAMMAKPRQVHGGRFRPCDLHQLADLVNEAKRAG